MELLVSDYDCTIETDRLVGPSYIPKGTISNIKNFRSGGNKFMIATARTYDSIMHDIKYYNIPYDFVSTLNGCIIHDNSGNLIYSKDIIDLDIDELYKLYSCIDKIELIKDMDKTLYYIFKTKFLKSSRRLIEYLEKSGLDVYSYFLNSYSIVHPVSNKVDSVRYIQELLDLDDTEIITVGDGLDDVKMLKNYYSYGVLKFLSNPEVMDYSNVKVKSLNDAFKYINKNI